MNKLEKWITWKWNTSILTGGRRAHLKVVSVVTRVPHTGCTWTNRRTLEFLMSSTAGERICCKPHSSSSSSSSSSHAALLTAGLRLSESPSSEQTLPSSSSSSNTLLSCTKHSHIHTLQTQLNAERAGVYLRCGHWSLGQTFRRYHSFSGTPEFRDQFSTFTLQGDQDCARAAPSAKPNNRIQVEHISFDW